MKKSTDLSSVKIYEMPCPADYKVENLNQSNYLILHGQIDPFYSHLYVIEECSLPKLHILPYGVILHQRGMLYEHFLFLHFL
jgi:hypothetical protein